MSISIAVRMHSARRRGLVAVQVIVLLAVLMGFAALTIDVGTLYRARGELQSAADAAALAGATAYTSDAMLKVRSTPTDTNSFALALQDVVSRANQVSQSNYTLGSPTLVELAGTDVASGWIDLNSATSPVDPTLPANQYNVVQVTVRRQSSSASDANGPVPFFLAPVLGLSDGNTVARAAAALDDRVAGLAVGTGGSDTMPVSVDEEYYAEGLNGGSDQSSDSEDDSASESSESEDDSASESSDSEDDSAGESSESEDDSAGESSESEDDSAGESSDSEDDSAGESSDSEDDSADESDESEDDNHYADNFGYDSESGTVVSGSDGIVEINIFPSDNGEGNFGLLNVGTPNNGVPGLSQQIENGITSDEMEAEVGTNELTFYDSDGEPNSYEITGNPGMKNGVESSFELRVGDVVSFFVHDSVETPDSDGDDDVGEDGGSEGDDDGDGESGDDGDSDEDEGGGANATYHITGIQFARVMHVQLTGPPSERGIWVQPVVYTGDDVLTSPTAPSTNGLLGRITLVR